MIKPRLQIHRESGIGLKIITRRIKDYKLIEPFYDPRKINK